METGFAPSDFLCYAIGISLLIFAASAFIRLFLIPINPPKR